MPAILDLVRQVVRQHELFRSDTRVVAALSGGSDSVALAHILNDLDALGELRLVGFTHLNHQLREAADDDERFCRRFAGALGKPMVIEQADVRARARRERRSIEDAAHAARYELFERARTALEADVVALGHTRDDQAETFLLRLIRGAGPRGLAGMHPRSGSIVRPLLGCRREQLRAWLALRRARGDRFADFVEDETNRDRSIPRNRVRAELLPLLAGRFNPGIVEVLAGEADLARDVWTWLEAAADDLAKTARAEPGDAPRSGSGRAVWFHAPALAAAPPAVARALVWRAMTDLAAGRPVSFDHVAAALELARATRESSLDFPGQRAQRIGSRLVLTTRRGRTGAENPGNLENAENPENVANPANLFRYPLSIPGEVALPHLGCVVSADVAERRLDRRAIVGNGPVATVRGDLCRGTLAVRNRRPGDRFRPVGLNGRKKLQDFFVDRKVARGARDGVPLVVDERDRIVWVAGYGIDEAFRVTDAAQPVLILKLRRA